LTNVVGPLLNVSCWILRFFYFKGKCLFNMLAYGCVMFPICLNIFSTNSWKDLVTNLSTNNFNMQTLNATFQRPIVYKFSFVLQLTYKITQIMNEWWYPCYLCKPWNKMWNKLQYKKKPHEGDVLLLQNHLS
jgi:hypothetical protein